ncbi:MAG TPA: shikimate dehydrogenase [Longimicrobium sp.]|nr:shikimate dehydrogenase [Longimicrobium sp.]
MTPPVTARTRLLALLGDPVSHSLSPVIQNAAMRAAGVDGVYVALRASSSEVPGLLRGLAHAGGAGNVTVPHKETAAAAVDHLTDAAEATGACNCFWLERGAVWGDNTDVEGVSAAIRMLLGRSIAGARVLVAGAGGGARAVVYAAARQGAHEVVVLNRTRDRAAELARRLGTARTPVHVVASVDEVGSDSFDLVVNATSLGLREEDPLPLAPARLPPVDAALDLVYSRTGETPWVRAMRARHVPSADGSEMLLMQGAAAFSRWWGIDPPLDAMRRALAELR